VAPPNVSIVVRKEGEKKGEKVKHEEISLNCLFWTYILKKSAHRHFDAWSLLLIHVRFYN
jgi:hypothetical protein